jgi:ureidoacrylate peracid hydrolase
MSKRHLILAGCVTDQCVAHALMDACDLGYLLTLVPEATATYSQQRQDAALAAVAGYCRMRSVEELARELLPPAASAVPMT